MKHLVLAISILSLVFSCSEKPIPTSDYKQEALSLIGKVDSSVIDTFKNWGYGTRGQAEIWSKKEGDSSLYSIWKYALTDTTILQVHKHGYGQFNKDFPQSIQLDTNKLRRFEFALTKDIVQINAVRANGRDTTLIEGIPLNQLFVEGNPYEHFGILTDLKDELGIIGASYMPRLGDFISFYISNGGLLFYVEDTAMLNPMYKDVWTKKFNNGIALGDKWILQVPDLK